ncbi:MAG: type 2 isopentenyl-diphosphate Delta-isomerase [Candidatus Diapherotrites archaeon]|nr:type 2 isopentenyl-diphosphate Delta-isomerase [Candidatus Diapherotrites archaeon]
MATEKRKEEHLDIALKESVSFRHVATGLEKVQLQYNCLPDISLEDVDTSAEFLGKKFNAPLMVSAITGGTERAKKINRDIAKACQKLGIGMGLGSQRAMLEKPELKDTYYVRDVAPDIFLAGNMGATQLRDFSVEKIEKALSEVGADALAIHLNAAQEAVQPDGTPDFRGAFEKIAELSKKLKKPVYVKEVGHGIGWITARKLAKTNIRAIDVQGAGGTSWIGIDSLRGNRELGETFWDFGIPTAVSIFECRQEFKGKIIASGGIRSGLDIIKGIILGADLGGIALPVLKAQAEGGEKGVEEYLEKIIREIKVGMFLLNARTIEDLKRKKK